MLMTLPDINIEHCKESNTTRDLSCLFASVAHKDGAWAFVVLPCALINQQSRMHMLMALWQALMSRESPLGYVSLLLVWLVSR